MSKLSYNHYLDFPEHLWRWPNFTPAEVACKGSGKLVLDTDAMDRLQRLRDRLRRPLYVNSAYRSPSHNAAVGGSPSSKHLRGEAFDISMSNHNPHVFYEAAKAVGFMGFGFYRDQNFIHIDLGPVRQWGHKWF